MSADGGTASDTPDTTDLWTEPSGPFERALLQAVVDSSPDTTVFGFDSDLRYRFVAGAALTRYGWSPEDFMGRTPAELLGPERGRVFEEEMRAALAGHGRRVEVPGVRGDAVWINAVTPLRAGGEVVGCIVVSRDVGEMRRAEQARRQSEAAADEFALVAAAERWRRERLEFLTEINDILGDCDDQEQIMTAVTRAAVPRLGDWCTMHVLLDPDDPRPAVAVAHVDAALVEEARKLQERFPYDPEGAHGVPWVVRTGRPLFYPEITDDLLTRLEVGEDAGAEVRRLGLRAAITVPLTKRHRVLGAMQFVLSSGERTYTQDDVSLAQALAGRVAASLENRRLAERQRDIAVTLQRGLLPATVPDVPGADLAVRYWAAGEVSEVGGDFYDVFAFGDGPHAVVIGDVCGTGPEAAAVTALLRHTVRANAWHGDTPAEVLSNLNRAILDSVPDVLCTVAYTVVVPSPHGGIDLTVALGGHPRPVLVRAGGAAEPIGTPGTLLGMLDETRHPTGTVHAGRGDTVVLYTDGATDLPPPSGMTEEEMVALIGSAARGVSAEAVAEAVFGALDERRPFARRNDDVALVVLRVL